MSKANSGWVRKQTAVLLSVTLALSPVLVVPAMAGETDGDAAPQEQTVENGEQNTDEGAEKDVEQTGAAEQNGVQDGSDQKSDSATGTQEVTEPPASDQAETTNVAQVEETGGKITYYTSLTEAVDAVNMSGGTLKLLAGTSENITIAHDKVTVTAAEGVVYKGSLTVTGHECIVTNMAFVLDPAGEVSKSLIVRGANDLNVSGNSFTIQAKNAGKEVQTNSIWIESGSTGTTISGNTFTIGFVVADNSAVAINIVGGSSAIENTNISGNEMTTTLGDLSTTDLDRSNMFFIIANGNASGISRLTVNRNSVSDKTGLSGKDSRTWGIGISGVSNATITNNTIDGYVAVCGTGWKNQKPCEELSVSGNTINSYYGVNMLSSNVTEGELAVFNNTFGPNVSFPVGGAVAVSDGEGTCYSSVNAAIAAGETKVVLERNLTESVTIPQGKDVTLDLAGHTLTNAEDLENWQGTITVEEGGSLTLTDSSEAGTGTVDSTKHATGALVNHGTVTVESGTLTRSKEAGSSPSNNGGNSWYVIDNQGTMTFDGGTVTSTGKFSSLVRNLNGTLTVNDGTFSNGFIALKNDDGGTLTINGGTITSDDQAVQSWSTTNISGGTLNGDVVAWDYTGSTNNCVTTISGDAVINGDVKAVNFENSSKAPQVDITGGTINGEVSKGAYKQETGVTPAEPTYGGSQITISGGSFSTRPDDALLASDLDAYERPDGSFGVAEPGNIFNVTIDGKKAQLAKGEKVAEPEVPARVGYTFLGWFANGSSTPYNFDTPVAGDLTVSQRWSLDADVSVSVSDPKPTEGDTVTLSASATSAAPGVSYAYQWLLDGKEIAGATQATYAATTDGTYTVRVTATDADQVAWTFTSAPVSLAFAAAPQPEQPAEKTYDVTFVWADGSTVTYLDIPEGSYVNAPTDAPTIDGWTFTGVWYTTRAADGTLSGVFDPKTTPVTSDLTLYAGWVPAGQQGQPEVPQTTPVEQQKPADEKGGKLAQTSDPTSAAPVAVAAAAGVSALAAAVATRRKRG